MSKKPYILSFDTTNETLSIAISQKNSLKQKFFSKVSSMQAEILIPEIEILLNKEKIWYTDLSAIAFTIGPGSFIGLRVGFAVAKTLHIATKIPLIGITCFEAIAYPYKLDDKYKDKNILVSMNARQGNVFIQAFNSNLKPLTDSNILKLDSEEFEKFISKDFINKDLVICGTAKEMTKQKIDSLKENDYLVGSFEDLIDAENVAKIGFEKLAIKDYNNEVEPLYIKPPRISKRKH